jgi:hypothetical protein
MVAPPQDVSEAVFEMMTFFMQRARFECIDPACVEEIKLKPLFVPVADYPIGVSSLFEGYEEIGYVQEGIFCGTRYVVRKVRKF